MVDALNRLPNIPASQTGQVGTVQRPQTSRTGAGQFGQVLEQELRTPAPIQFSAHAQSRLQTRQIQLSPDQVNRLERGVNQAAQKGAHDSLVMVDNLAFIVSVNNRTVVTAVDGAQASGNVFTQIDSAVIA